jgi:type I restriction enzyme, S subunit
MSFPRYPKYKGSGVEWLGKVPEHWDVLQLKRIINLQSGSSITSEAITESGEFPVFGGNGFRGFTTEFTHDGNFVLVGRQGALCGNVNYASQKFWASEHALVINLLKQINIIWLGETLRTMNLNQYSVAAAQPGLSVEVVERLRVCVPPLEEQTQIALFLDRETAKIDKLVAEQQQLMALLKEKRQAVISHAVTKGLNPQAPMKPSGVEWLGDVPEHWEVTQIKRQISTIEQGWSPQCSSFPVVEDSEWGVLKVGCVNGGRFNPVENKALPPELQPIPNLGIMKDDLLISRANSPELVGSAALADQDYKNLMLCDKLYRLRMDKHRMSPSFITYFLSTHIARSLIELAATGASSSMVNIAQNTILNIWLAIPQIDEQIEIVRHLSCKVLEIERLIEEARYAIQLLIERRTSLISAAVTGQIDVRNFA